jgi:acetolactate synthase-1/2/3 large subunit
MTGQELATAMQYGVAPLIVVFNNARYGTIETHQDLHYPGRRIATELVNPDFAAYARAFGAFGARVHDNTEFDAVLPEALAAGRAALIELMLDGS